MTSSQLPPAFAYLRNDCRAVIDQAIVEALPHLEPAMQREALDLLIERSHAGTLTQLVAQYRMLPPTLHELVRSRASELSVGIRAGMASSSAEARLAAIDLLVDGHADQLAYLLADVLREPCSRTRERAANGLAELVERFLDTTVSGSLADAAGPESRAGHLREALAKAIGRWDQHTHPTVLSAALAMGELTEASIRQRIGQRQTNLTQALSRLFAQGPDPRLAASALRLLDIQEVRGGVLTALGNSSNAPFVRALLRETWLLADPGIAGASRKLSCGAWTEAACRWLTELPSPHVDGAVRFLACLGGPADRKEALLRNLLDTGDDNVRRAVVWQLVEDERESSTGLLGVVASRGRDGSAVIADRELRRRRRRRGGIDHRARTSDADEPPSVIATLDRLWQVFGHSGETSQAEALRAACSQEADRVCRWLRERLAESNPVDRVRALRIAEALDLLSPLAESLLRLAHDTDASVRSHAVSLLPNVPGSVTQRILRSAINDPDARVQANAIEALEKLGTPNLAGTIKEKLTSQNNRVRANAIKSLLGVELKEAGDALLDMLEHDSPSHRLSALWVVERMRLTTLLDRLALLSAHDPDPKVRLRAARLQGSLASHSEPRECAGPRRAVGEWQ